MEESDMPAEVIRPYIDMMRGFDSRMDDNKRLSWAQRQVYIALGNALNGAKALGFDSCPMEGFNPAEFAKVLKLKENIVPAVLCPIGYADDEPRLKSRFPKEDIIL